MVFESRQEAGKKLATKLIKFREDNPFVLALPRGGVPIGFEVADVLHAPLDVIIVRKIGLSSNPEFGIGAIAEGGVKVLDQTSIEVLGIDETELEDTIKLEEEELSKRVKTYHGNDKLPNLTGKTAILVDDGMATGITAKAAIEAVRKLNPKKIILASPVCAIDTAESLKSKIDEVICLATPFEFMAVGSWYKNFEQLSDEENVNLLKKSKRSNKLVS
ncbi:phosphoribosyltransferase [Candidatus Daviesbacteria bacterium]|nr:phosphoribosyltransferase [Candidatus Daviesbacteria bacterium]